MSVSWHWNSWLYGCAVYDKESVTIKKKKRRKKKGGHYWNDFSDMLKHVAPGNRINIKAEI